MQHTSLAERGNALAHLVPRTLLSFFRRPNMTRKLHDDGLSVEIENLPGSPGLSYCRFYDQNDRIFLPQDVMCIDLVTSSEVQNMSDPQGRPAFVLCDASWYAFCNREIVLAYVHSVGAICLPDEVIPYPELTEPVSMMNEASYGMAYGLAQGSGSGMLWRY